MMEVCSKSRQVLYIVISFSLLVIFVGSEGAFSCPSGCRCTIARRQQSDQMPILTPGRRVVCQGGTALTRVTPMFIGSLPQDTVQLDLSGNAIEELYQDTFQTLTSLQRLNLSYNPLTVLAPGAFRGLENLERLDLSGTRLTVINSSMLEGIPRLQRLILQNSSVRTLYSGAFSALPSLARLDLQTASLVCECHLEWIVDWLQSSKVRVDPQPVCSIPTALRGRTVKSLTKADLHCAYPLELAVFELTPFLSQVAFEGDKLPLECRVTEPPVGMTMNVTWTRNSGPSGALEEIQTDRSRGLFVNVRSEPDKTRVTTVVVERLDVRRDAGNWTCRVTTSVGGVAEQSVLVVVLSSGNKGGSGGGEFCPMALSDSNRGRYVWPRTLAGVVAELPCVAAPIVGDGRGASSWVNVKARRRCDGTGRWLDADVHRCPFTSETTRRLEEYSFAVAANQTDRLNNLAENIKQLVGDGRSIGDKDDVILLSRVIEGLSRSVGANKKLGEVVVELVAMVMNASSSVLNRAHQEDKVFNRLVKSIETVADQLLYDSSTIHIDTSNVAVRAHKVDPRGFVGITCSMRPPPLPPSSAVGSALHQEQAATPRKDPQPEERFSCADMKTDHGDDVTQEDHRLEASIQVLADYLLDARCIYPECSPHTDSYRMTFIVYHNSSLFPLSNDSTGFRFMSPTVISGKIAGVTNEGVNNITGRITVQIGLPSNLMNRAWIPAYWNSSANGGYGAWLTDGCELVGYPVGTVVTFRCNHLSSFTLLLSDAPESTDLQALLSSWQQTGLIVYIGSGILLVCLLVVVMIYTIHRRTIMMSRKLRHCVVNLCIATTLLCVTFTLGIQVTRPVIACRTIGISIHYLSLCTPLWITLIAYKLYNRLFKRHSPHQTFPDEVAIGEKPKPKPVVTSYLLGWGVAVIVCGISGAINWVSYASENFCFLAMEAAFLTLFVPAGVIILVNFLLFIRICCLLRYSPSGEDNSSRCDDPDTDETHDTNEIEVLSPRRLAPTRSRNATRSIPSDSASSSDVSSILDPVYKPSKQLSAAVTLLVLFCLMWVSGACVVSPPFVFPYYDVVYQCSYAATAAGFGLFIVIYYCIGRPEVRALSCSCRRRRRRHKVSCRGDVAAKSRKAGSSSNGSVHRDESGHMEHVVIVHSSNHLTPAISGPPSVADRVSLAAKSVSSEYERSQKASPCAVQPISAVTPSLVVPTLSVVAAAPGPDFAMFYNQRQNGVARKYWERAKKKRAAAQLRHVPLSPRDVEKDISTSTPHRLRRNGELARRPVFECDIYVGSRSGDNHLDMTLDSVEQEPLLSILVPENGEVALGDHCDSDVSSSVEKAQQNSLAERAVQSPPARDVKCVRPNGFLLESVNVVANGSAKRTQQNEETKVDRFIEQLEMRIPSTVSKPNPISPPPLAKRQESLPAHDDAVKPTGGVDDRMDAAARSPPGGDDTSATLVVSRNYGATSSTEQAVHLCTAFEELDDESACHDELEVRLSAGLVEPCAMSSMSDLSACDVWVMQNEKSQGKSETIL